MYRKLMDILMVLAREVVEKDMNVEDALVSIRASQIDLYSVREELRAIERMNLMSDDETDALKSMLVYLLIENTELAYEDIYTVVFGSGKQIIWH